MKIVTEELELVAAERLTPHPQNPRCGDVERIRGSIAANGFVGAVVVQRSTGHILAGNHRYRAALADGATHVPVLWADVDDDVARRILLADNRTGDAAGYDAAALDGLLRQLAGEAPAALGYTAAELEDLLGEGDLPAGDESAALVERWQVLIDCADESAQADALTRLVAEGYACRALVS